MIPKHGREAKDRSDKYDEQGFKMLDEIILPEHKEFKKFIEAMVDINCRTRISARKALDHKFLNMDIKAEYEGHKRKTHSKSKSTKHSSSVPKNTFR